MARQHSDKAPVTFQDVAACFSEKEWKLLHEWQKELYRNVMTDIQQALICLGPLIASSVFSLRGKEKDDLCIIENEDFQRHHLINHSPEDVDITQSVSFSVKEEGTKYSMGNNGLEKNDNISNLTGYPSPNTNTLFRMDEESVDDLSSPFGAEVEKSVTSHEPVFSFRIKEEKETFTIDDESSEITENICSPSSDPEFKHLFSQCVKPKERNMIQKQPEHEGKPTGERRRKRKMQSCDYLEKCAEKSTSCQASQEEPNLKVLGKADYKRNSANSENQLWSETVQDLGGQKTTACESGLLDPEHSILYSINSHTDQSDTFTDCVTKQRDAKFLTRKSNEQKYLRPYQCGECEKSFKAKQDLTRHQRTHSGERPFTCSVCQKSFSMKHHLTRHQSTHTGERSYHYTEYGTIFSRKGNLGHLQRTHVESNQTGQLVDITPMKIPSWRNEQAKTSYQCT